jgi:soluble lytic murein transglycosylase-like protein
MRTSAYLLAALVFAVPTNALTNPPEILLALNALPVPYGLRGAEFGRFFDASARYAPLPLPEVAATPAAPPKPLPPRAAPAAVPFTVEVPPLPPAFDRLSSETGYDALIRSHADRFGLDPRLIKSVIAAESEFTARAKSPAGALGLMQVMPATAGEMGVPRGALFDPEANILAGTAYMTHLFERAWKRYHLKGVAYTDAPAWLVQRIVAAYNAGPRFLARRKLYAQTRDYVRKVLMFYRSKVSELRAA